ncbi:sensor histidine kinase [Nocardia panacis]|uniref:sensor histidine kinase n=1 Tax=Nocardia panacis TaxID=2340916 RepID=UPI00193A9DCA|nr:histidine kinase [Nocardia panacis]
MSFAMWWVRWRGALVDGVRTLALGLYAILALPLLVYTAVTCLVGIGFVLVPPQLWVLGRVADAERRRIARRRGTIAETVDRPFRWLPALVTDPTVWRELRWVAFLAVGGTVLGALGTGVAVLPLLAFAAIWLWWLFPADDPIRIVANIPIAGWPSALTIGVAQCAITAAVAVAAGPALGRAGLWLSNAGLRVSAKKRLTQQVAALRRTRSGAVDAHTADLRRIERDLHDGTQAHLVALALRLGLASRALDRDPSAVGPLLEEARAGAEAAMSDLRTVLRTTYPPILADQGLDGAVAAVAARCTVPTAVRVELDRELPAAVEAAVYFVVTEALTNIARHAGATSAAVEVRTTADGVAVEIRDNGRGGVDPARGTGVAGMLRRLEALDGVLTVDSPPGGPTVLRAVCPCG